MHDFYPVLICGGTIGLFAAVATILFFAVKEKKEFESFDRNMKDGEIVKRLWRYAFPHKTAFLLIFLLMIISIAFEVISPIVASRIEDMMEKSFTLKQLFTGVDMYVALLIISIAATYFQALLLQKLGQKILSALRMDVFEHIEQLSHAQLNKIPVGKLVTRVANDTDAISMMFTNVLVNISKNFLVVVGVLIAMFCLSRSLTLLVLCFMPFVVLFSFIFRKFARMAHRKVKDANTDLNTFLSENLSGMKVIQAYNQEDRKMEEFTAKSKKQRSARRERLIVNATFQPMIYALYISAVLFLFYLSARGYIKNISFLGETIPASLIVAFYMYINKFFNPLQQLTEQFNTLQSAFASAEKIFSIMDMEPEVVDSPDAIELETVRGEIEFKHVWFAYEDENWILKDVSFHVEPKQTVALVGATGAGKSTILSLLCRNYDIQKGQILVDGIDIKDIKIASLRRHFGQMLQDVFLFSGTVKSNIVLREDSFTDKEVLQACKYVNADSFISKLDKGIYEEVRERGNNFSAGQRQLLSFARTLIHKPEVMILDEATANIDTETELLIQDSLEKLKSVGTMIIVAHRLSTIQHSDNIILLSHGEIMEQGSHQQLLEKKGMYYELYTLQYSKEQLLSQTD